MDLRKGQMLQVVNILWAETNRLSESSQISGRELETRCGEELNTTAIGPSCRPLFEAYVLDDSSDPLMVRRAGSEPALEIPCQIYIYIYGTEQLASTRQITILKLHAC